MYQGHMGHLVKRDAFMLNLIDIDYVSYESLHQQSLLMRRNHAGNAMTHTSVHQQRWFHCNVAKASTLDGLVVVTLANCGSANTLGASGARVLAASLTIVMKLLAALALDGLT